MYIGNNHLVIIGWNERVKNLLFCFGESLSLTKIELKPLFIHTKRGLLFYFLNL